MFNPFRRAFLSKSTAALAGLFGAGAVKASEVKASSKDLVIPLRLSPTRLRMVDSFARIQAEIARINEALQRDDLIDSQKTALSHALQTLTWAAESMPAVVSPSGLWGVPLSSEAREAIETLDSEAYEYRVVADFRDAGGAAYFHDYAPDQLGRAMKRFADEKHICLYHSGSSVELQRARLGAWETVERAEG